MAGAGPRALRRSNKRKRKKIRDSSGELIWRVRVCSKDPCFRQQPMSRGVDWSARRRLGSKVDSDQTEVAPRSPDRMGLGLREVRWRAVTEDALSAASRSHCLEK